MAHANQFTKLTDAERFFYYHAGFSYDPKIETRQQRKLRCAREMADAEAYARRAGWTFSWFDDWQFNHTKEYGREYEPQTCECCQLQDADGEVLESLCCIDDADANYRRVIEAELADQALYSIRKAEARDAQLKQFVNVSYAL